MESQSENNIIYSSSAEYLIYVTIGIVYVTLMSLLVDRILGYEQIEKECEYRSNLNLSLADQAQEVGRRRECEIRRNEYMDKRFSHMMIIGVISLLVGGYVTTLNGSYNVAGAGVALGGLFSVIYTSLTNWHRITSDLKIVMLTVALVSLGYGSTIVF